MVLTLNDLALRDRQLLSYHGAPTGSQVSLSAVITGSIVIGSVSANVDNIYIQSGDQLNLGTTWTGVGSVVVSGTLPTTLTGVGSVVISGTSIPVNRGVGSVVISGTSIPVFRGTGSVVISGTTQPPMRGTSLVNQDRGVFNYSGLGINNADSDAYIGSFTGSYLQFPGTGSKLLLKGFTLSCKSDAAGCHARVIFSGALLDTTHVMTFNMPPSGTVAMNLIGMEISGPTNLQIGVGNATATGSLYATFMTSDTL